jgi:hypothetical protein
LVEHLICKHVAPPYQVIDFAGYKGLKLACGDYPDGKVLSPRIASAALACCDLGVERPAQIYPLADKFERRRPA